MKKEVFGWSIYDLANTGFSSLFVTFFFPLYIKVFLGGNEFQIGLVFGISMLFVALLVPFIGAYSDITRKRMPFVILFTLICVTATFLVPLTHLLGALLLGGLANFAYHAALTTYNAILPRLGAKKEYGKISGIGVGFGYAGNFLSIGAAAIVLSILGWETLKGIKSMFYLTAIFFLLFSLVTFFIVKEKNKKLKPEKNKFKIAVKQVKTTVLHLRKYKGLIYYLISTFLIMNAVSAAIVFLYLYGRMQINLTIPQYMIVFCLFSITAILGAIYFGKLSDKIGAKKALTISVILWILVITLLIFVSSFAAFLIAGLIGGVGWGAVITCIRPLLLDLTPKTKVGEFFGFSEFTSKFSGIIGPAAFGGLVVLFNYTAALILLLIFFISGGIVLQKCQKC